MKNKRILISQETEKLEEKKTLIAEALPIVSSLWSHYQQELWYDKGIDLKTLINGNELLILNYKKTLIAGHLPEINGLEIDEYQALKLYKTPVNQEFESNLIAAKAKEVIEQIKFFSIKNSKVIINPIQIEGLENEMTVYAENEKEIALYKAYTKLMDAFNELDDILINHPGRILDRGKKFMPGFVFIMDENSKKLGINAEQIKTYMRTINR